jgi:thymidylate synthase
LQVFEARTADEAWRAAADQFQRGDEACRQPGRGGAAWELLPAMFVIKDPSQRWVISRNPAMSAPFALVEIIGIIAGRQDSEYLNFFNPRLPQFAGSGCVYPGAYGFRLRRHFGIDQLERVYAALERNAHSRQAVLQIWDPRVDIPLTDGSPASPDIPCNLCSMLKVRNGRLYWTQILRSNDLFRGTPYNFVQFSVLQEVVAGWLGVTMGSYTQLSDSLHVYERDMQNLASIAPLDAPASEDSLLLPKSASDLVWSNLNKSVTELIAPGLHENEVEEIALQQDYPAAQNILLIVAADSARRRAYYDLAKDLSSRCRNPLLSFAWQRWDSRTMRRQSTSP